MKKYRIVALLLVLVMVCTMFAACNQPDTSTDSTGDSGSDTTTVKKDIKFYAKIVEYTSGEAMCEKMTELLADEYNIECLQVDWGNLDTVIRTAISSGEPCDIYEYWPQNIRPLVDSGMCLDLTPYLTANDNEWLNTFVDGTLEAGKYDGKYYAVPLNANYSIMIANKEVLDAAGVTIPDNWTWEEFTSVCQQLQDKGYFAVAANTDNAQGDWFFRNGLLSLSASAGKLEEMAAASIPCTDEIFTTAFTNVAGLYENGYMYPGEGAVTLTLDEAKAAFYQSKAAIFCCTSASLKATLADADFEAVVLPWPSMGEVNAVLGGYDGLFIPSNVEDPDAAVEVLKTYLSAEVQAIHAEHGFAVVNKDAEITDELTQQVVEQSCNVYSFEFQNTDAKLAEYLVNQALAEVVLGDGVEAALNALEQLRLEAVE